MFGRPLEDTMALESRLGGRYVPLMVHKCVEFVRKHGEGWVGGDGGGCDVWGCGE